MFDKFWLMKVLDERLEDLLAFWNLEKKEELTFKGSRRYGTALRIKVSSSCLSAS